MRYCYECNGTGLISECCDGYVAEASKKVKNDSGEVIETQTLQNRYVCSECNKFTKTIVCYNCDGSGMIPNGTGFFN